MTNKEGDLAGKVALVTGAGGGIGAKTVRSLAVAGAHVVATGPHAEPLQQLYSDLKEEGIEIATTVIDISDELSVKRGIEFARDSYGRLDILDNNAAMQGIAGDTDVASMSVDVWDSIMGVNARGTMLMCKHAIPLMLEGGGGSIINISSGTSLAGDMQFTAYAASKGAINTLTRYVATQYGAQGVRCNALALGLIGTPALEAGLPPPVIELFKASKLSGRIGTPDDVAEMVTFLASDRAGFITGQIWSVDGGFFAHVPTTAGMAALMAQMQGHSS